MKKPFSIIQIRKDLGALYADAITISKLVEIFNARSEEANSYQWVGFLEELPADGQSIIVQYKTFEFGDCTFHEASKDWYYKNCQCWLKK